MIPLIQHYDEHGSCTGDWLRAMRALEADCEPLMPLGAGPLEPEAAPAVAEAA